MSIAQQAGHPAAAALSFTLTLALFMAATSDNESTGTVLTPEKNGFRFGIYTAVALCIYTLIAVVAGFFQNVTAGTLDVLLLVGGVVLAIRNFRNVRGEHMPYLGGYGTGIVTAIVASVILGLFFLATIAIFPHKIDLTQVHNLFENDESGIIAFLAIVLLGAMSGVMTSLIAMQYYKVDPVDPLDAAERTSRR